jgi:DNA polymerase-3 subunit beta
MVDKDKLLSAVKRAALFTKADSMAIKMELMKDKLVVSKSAPDIGEARIELDAEYKGKDLTVGFRPEYLIDLLKNLGQEKAAFEMSDPEKPGVLRIGGEYIYVVMPMHID